MTYERDGYRRCESCYIIHHISDIGRLGIASQRSRTCLDHEASGVGARLRDNPTMGVGVGYFSTGFLDRFWGEKRLTTQLKGDGVFCLLRLFCLKNDMFVEVVLSLPKKKIFQPDPFWSVFWHVLLNIIGMSLWCLWYHCSKLCTKSPLAWGNETEICGD